MLVDRALKIMAKYIDKLGWILILVEKDSIWFFNTFSFLSASRALLTIWCQTYSLSLMV